MFGKINKVENCSDLMDRFNEIATDVLNARGDNKGINNKKVAVSAYRGMLSAYTAKQRQLSLNNMEGTKEMNRFAFDKASISDKRGKAPSEAQVAAAANARNHRLGEQEPVVEGQEIANEEARVA
jgi:hypothetical protein|tara:strand:+ start:97 stop:471 length:375 start_codon:yes stop_codon:yes gene_type:complete